jgi:hypothetical protein
VPVGCPVKIPVVFVTVGAELKENVKDGVPPPTVTVAEPFESPKQATGLVTTVEVISEGERTAVVAVLIQLFPSCTVKVYKPGHRLVAVAALLTTEFELFVHV